MKSKIKKALSLFLALLTALSICSCAIHINKPDKNETESNTDTNQSAVQTADDDWAYVENDFSKEVKNHLNSIGDADYAGTSFMIASFAPELTDPDKCGTVMSPAVYDRNKLVEDRFNIEIYTKEADPDTIYTELYNASLADDFYADLIVVPQYYIAQFAAGGTLINLLSLPFTDYTAGYNISSGVEAGMASSDGYALAGWATLQPDKLPCVFFSRTLLDKAGLEYPYALVKSGEWTWDKFFEYSEAASALDVESYGCQNTSQNMGDIVYISCGNKFINAGEGNAATVAVEAESTNIFADIAYKLFNDPYKSKNSIEAISTFANGGSLFLIENLGEIKNISNSENVWGVLPMPKASAGQSSYKSLAASNSAFFAVPTGCSSAEKTSRIMAALNAASLGFIADAYVTDSMYYYLRDNESVNMVEKICYSAYYDMAYSVGTDDLTIANSTYFAVRNVYENNHDINFYIDSFAYRANTALSRIFPY